MTQYLAKIWTNSAPADHSVTNRQTSRRYSLRFGEFPPQICKYCGDTYRYNYETINVCKLHLVFQQMIETSSKSIRNRRRYPSLKCYKIDENLRFSIRRSAVAPSDATYKTAIWCTTKVPQVHNHPKDILEDLLTLWLLVRTNLFVPSHFYLRVSAVVLATATCLAGWLAGCHTPVLYQNG